MKKIGEYTARGTCADRTQTRIVLFDGSFKTAYKIVEFQILSTTPESTADVVGVLKTDGTEGASMTTPFWNLAENDQIAWSGSDHPAAAGGPRGSFSLVDPDNLVVEDLFVTSINSVDQEGANYFVRMEKYQISDWQGALSMVRGKSQNV